jgi:O-antigen ligase
MVEIAILGVAMAFIYNVLSSKIELGANKKHYMPIGIILIGILIATLYSGSQWHSWGIIKSWFIIPIFFAWMVSRSKIKKETIAEAIYSSSIIVSSIALGYYFLGKITFDGRLQAFYNSPNFLAMFLAPAIIIGIDKIRNSLWRQIPFFMVIATVFYLTRSYAAWIAVMMSSLILIGIKKEKYRLSKIALVLAIGGIILFLQIGTSKWEQLVAFQDRSSSMSRMMIWSAALKIGWDNPIIGIGPGRFQEKYLEYQKYFPPYLEWAVPQPHNLWLAIWLQLGILGVVGFGWLLVIWLKEFADKKDKKEIDYMYLGIMLSILIHGMVDTPYFKNDLAIIFWLIIFQANQANNKKIKV